MKHTLMQIDYTEYPYPPTDYEHYVYYKCSNCGAYFEDNASTRMTNYYGFRKYMGYEKLSCEEVIIKNIIE